MLLRVLERLVALLFWVAVTAVAFSSPPSGRWLPWIGAAIGLVLLGLAVLAMEFTPRRPRSLLHHAGERVTFTLDRRGLERRLTRTAELDTDVDDAKVRIRRRAKVKVNKVEGSDNRSMSRRVRDRLREELDQLVEKRTPKVKVDVNVGGGRVR